MKDFDDRVYKLHKNLVQSFERDVDDKWAASVILFSVFIMFILVKIIFQLFSVVARVVLRFLITLSFYEKKKIENDFLLILSEKNKYEVYLFGY